MHRWQTETGAHMITPLPGATPLKPGSATKPFFGVAPAVLNEQGKELEGAAEGWVISIRLSHGWRVAQQIKQSSISSALKRLR